MWLGQGVQTWGQPSFSRPGLTEASGSLNLGARSRNFLEGFLPTASRMERRLAYDAQQEHEALE